MMIRIRDLVHKYTIWESDTKKSKKTVLDGISLDIPSGQFVAVLGPNGCGKSTLAKHLNVLLLPDSGTVWIDGKDTADVERLWDIRYEVGMVFQNPDNQIVGTSVEEDVAFGPENRNMEPEDIQCQVEKSLHSVNMFEKRKMSPSRLSGGQKQRVAIAGTIAGNPKCIVLDEPTAMLDPISRREVMELIRYLNKELGITILLITHHTDEVVDADSIILMNHGKIIKQGTPEEIFCDTELLKQVKMDVPQVTVLGEHLQQHGIPMKLPVLHEQECIAQLMEYADGKSLKKMEDTIEKAKQFKKTVLEIRDLSFAYGEKTNNECQVFDHISFDVHEGEFIGLIGASGSGKTTLIKHLNGLLKAKSGTILFEGTNIYDKKFRLSSLRKEVGLVFQYPEHQLFGKTVLDDVMYGPLHLGMSKEEAMESAKKCLRMVDIEEAYEYVSPLELSGGEKRRVAIAGVLAMKPKVLVLDEPAAGLDPETKHRIFDLLISIKKETNVAIVLVSHHMEDVAEYADTVYVLNQGKLELSGTPEEVFEQTGYLKDIGIGVPQITSLTEQLIQNGLPLAHPAVTVAQAEQMIWNLFGEQGGEQ